MHTNTLVIPNIKKCQTHSHRHRWTLVTDNFKWRKLLISPLILPLDADTKFIRNGYVTEVRLNGLDLHQRVCHPFSSKPPVFEVTL